MKDPDKYTHLRLPLSHTLIASECMITVSKAGVIFSRNDTCISAISWTGVNFIKRNNEDEQNKPSRFLLELLKSFICGCVHGLQCHCLIYRMDRLWGNPSAG